MRSAPNPSLSSDPRGPKEKLPLSSAELQAAFEGSIPAFLKIGTLAKISSGTTTGLSAAQQLTRQFRLEVLNQLDLASLLSAPP
jgi:hypothetical protein